MSIATEAARLQNAKTSIRNAIASKGVSVPTSAKLDTYAGYINNISGGSIPTTIIQYDGIEGINMMYTKVSSAGVPVEEYWENIPTLTDIEVISNTLILLPHADVQMYNFDTDCSEMFNNGDTVVLVADGTYIAIQ